MPDRLRAAILLGGLAGLRLVEACGLRMMDIDFMRGIFNPAVQDPAEGLKTDYSKTPVPVGRSLTLQLAAHAQQWPAETLLTGQTVTSSARGHWNAPYARPGPR